MALHHPFSAAGKPLPSADILNSKNPLPFAATFRDSYAAPPHYEQTSSKDKGKGKALDRETFGERPGSTESWPSRMNPFPFRTPPASPSFASTSKSPSKPSTDTISETKQQVAERKITECVANAAERLDLSDRALEVLPDSVAELRFISRLRRREIRGSSGQGSPRSPGRSNNPLSMRRSSPLPSSPGRRLDFDLADPNDTSPTNSKRIWARSKSLPESAFTQSSSNSPAGATSVLLPTSPFPSTKDRYGSSANPFGLGPPPSSRPAFSTGFDAPGSPLPAADAMQSHHEDGGPAHRRFATAPSKLRVRFGDTAGAFTKSMNDVVEEKPAAASTVSLGRKKGMSVAKSMSALTFGESNRDGREGLGRTASGRVQMEGMNWVGEGSADVELMLASNHLTRLPSALFMVTNLTVLSLRANRLKRLPAGIGQLSRLKELNVSNNLIRYFPPSIIDLKELDNLMCVNNPLIKEDYEVTPFGRRLGPLVSQADEEISLRSLCFSRLLSTYEPDQVPLFLSHYDYNPVEGKEEEVHALQDADALHKRTPEFRIEECRRIIPALRSAFYAAPGRVHIQGLPEIASSPIRKPVKAAATDQANQDETPPEPYIEDAADNPFFSPCPNPLHYIHSHSSHRLSRWLYLHSPAEERIEYVDLPEAKGMPIKWEGCQRGCLDFLVEQEEEDDDDESMVATDVDEEDGFDADVLGNDGSWA